MACQQCDLMDEISTEDHGQTFCKCGRTLARIVRHNGDQCTVVPTSKTNYFAHFHVENLISKQERDFYKIGVHAEMREDLGEWMRECREGLSASAPAAPRE